MRILFVGDVVGRPGREACVALIPSLRAEHEIDVCVVNGENSAGGVGINARCAEQIFGAGADAITLGNHAFRQRDSHSLLDEERRIVRPVNYPRSDPGRGSALIDVGDRRLGILSISGAMQLTVARAPFPIVHSEVDALRREGADAILVDFHAEVTSEKVAMGWHLDGEVAAVIGTHTHVPTADARVLPGGTAHITDVGMTGPRDSVLGVRIEDAVATFTSQLPRRFETAEGAAWMCAVVIEVGGDGLARSIEQLLIDAPG